MGILERTRHVIRADLNDLLRRARNPEAVLDGYLDDLQMVLAEAGNVRSAEEAERGLYASRLRDLEAAQRNWEEKARTCLKIGDEDLARSALEHKLDLREEAVEVERELDQREASLAVLDENLESLKARMAEVSRMRRELRFRRQLVEARSELQQAIRSLGPREEQPALDAAQDGLVELESRLEASEELHSEDVDERVLRLEVADRRRRRRLAVDQELEALRRSVPGKKKA